MKKYFPTVEKSSLLLLVGSLFFSLIVGEALTRWHMFGSNAWSYSKISSIRHIGKSGLLQPSAHLDILWELRPNVERLYKLWPFSTNSAGLRDREYSLSKPPNTFRVAVIGDSFTMAEGVPIEEAYHSRLEDAFNSLADGRNYEFINFGVAGYSLPQYSATIRRKVLAYQPDVILIGFCAANDSKIPNLEAFKKPYQVKAEKDGFIHFYSLEILGNVYKRLYRKLRGRYPGYNADAAFVEAQFQEISAISKAHHVPIIVAYIDNKAASSDFPIIQSAAEKSGFEFVDGTKNFSKDVSVEHIIYLTDNHPNGAANRVFAETLFPALRSTKAFGFAGTHSDNFK